MTKPKAAPITTVINVGTTSADRTIAQWAVSKVGDSVELAGEAAGEIAGAFDASSEAYSATREVSRSTRVANVRARAIARAAAAGITLSFT